MDTSSTAEQTASDVLEHMHVPASEDHPAVVASDPTHQVDHPAHRGDSIASCGASSALLAKADQDPALVSASSPTSETVSVEDALLSRTPTAAPGLLQTTATKTKSKGSTITSSDSDSDSDSDGEEMRARRRKLLQERARSVSSSPPPPTLATLPSAVVQPKAPAASPMSAPVSAFAAAKSATTVSAPPVRMSAFQMAALAAAANPFTAASSASKSREEDMTPSTLPIEFVSITDEHRVAIMHTSASFSFVGEVSVKVLRGCIEVLGCKIACSKGAASQSFSLYSPPSHSALTVLASRRAGKQDASAFSFGVDSAGVSDDARLLQRVLPVMARMSNDRSSLDTLIVVSIVAVHSALQRAISLTPTFPSDFKPNKPKFELLPSESPSILSVPRTWHQVADEFIASLPSPQSKPANAHAQHPVLMSCGGKNVGKSSMSRYVINRLLQVRPVVAVLETDIGQSEFLPGGFVSLHYVHAPLLGPPFTHPDRSPAAAKFLGSTNPHDCPVTYLHCIALLVDQYRARCSHEGFIPLVVNTHGWIRGLGIPILAQLIELTTPAVVVHHVAGSGAAPFTLESISKESFFHAFASSNSASTKKPTNKSSPKVYELHSESHTLAVSKISSLDIRTLSFVSYFCGLNGKTLSAQPTYRVPFASVGIHVLFDNIAYSQLLATLDSSIVALCHMPSLTTDVSDDRPLCHVAEIDEPSSFGLGIIRSIDVSQRVFYIITPLAPSLLKSVNLLVRGTLTIPEPILQGQSVGAAYLSSEFSAQATGGAHAQRRAIKRRRFTKAP